jgi:hypothetical protein
MSAVDLQLDYFQIYDLEPVVSLRGRRLATRTVALRGQFDEEPETGVLTGLIRFADRVSKNGERLYDKGAHLTWYTWVRPLIRRPRWRRVQVSNQFAEEQELHIREAAGLWVPARKKILPDGAWSEKSTRLYHYRVYRVAWAQEVKYPSIELEDQFGGRKTRPLYPVAFAVPVWKKREGQSEPMPDGAPGAAHLTIYRVEPSEKLSVKIATRDQFYAFRSLKLGASELLAVPSQKRGWEEG